MHAARRRAPTRLAPLVTGGEDRASPRYEPRPSAPYPGVAYRRARPASARRARASAARHHDDRHQGGARRYGSAAKLLASATVSASSRNSRHALASSGRRRRPGRRQPDGTGKFRAGGGGGTQKLRWPRKLHAIFEILAASVCYGWCGGWFRGLCGPLAAELQTAEPVALLDVCGRAVDLARHRRVVRFEWLNCERPTDTTAALCSRRRGRCD